MINSRCITHPKESMFGEVLESLESIIQTNKIATNDSIKAALLTTARYIDALVLLITGRVFDDCPSAC